MDNKDNKNIFTFSFVLLSVLGLLIGFAFQNFNIQCLCFNPFGFYQYLPDKISKFDFIVNKLARYIINNLSFLILIKYLINDNIFLRNIVLIQLLILLIILPIYFYLAFSEVTILNMMYQKLNAVIINPVVIFILSASFYIKSKI